MLFGEKQFMVCEENVFCHVLLLLASDLFRSRVDICSVFCLLLT